MLLELYLAQDTHLWLLVSTKYFTQYLPLLAKDRKLRECIGAPWGRPRFCDEDHIVFRSRAREGIFEASAVAQRYATAVACR